MNTVDAAGTALLKAVQDAVPPSSCPVPGLHDGGRTVTADPTGALLSELRQCFGEDLCEALADEFGLDPAPGQPLPSQAAAQALEAAQTARQVMGGVDFLTLLNHSAAANGADYRRLAWQMGLDPDRLEPSARRRIDAGVQRRFEEHRQGSQAALRPAVVYKWLKSELFVLTK